MASTFSASRSIGGPWRRAVALTTAALLAFGDVAIFAQEPPPVAADVAASPAPVAPEAPPPPIPPEQLDSLVAPVALYPDPLLAQVLVASTYPLEIVQLHQWLAKNKGLKDKALADAVAKQPWDPSIQSMAAIPDVVDRLATEIQWTTDLGNAFLAQQSDVMDAVQRMRAKAQANGALTSNEKQVVETKVIEQKTVIVVEQASPEVVYVPSYSPVVVYGPPVYAYPPIYYPPYPAGAALVTFGVGMAVGAAVWGGGSCCGCGWGGNDVNVNVNNNYNKVNHYSGNGKNGNWNHNPTHRGGAPYSNRATASKYGGTARGQSPSARQAGAGQQASRSGASAGATNRGASPSASNRGASPSATNRSGGGGTSWSGSQGAGDRSAGGASSRSGSAGVSERSSGGSRASGGGGGERVGDRSISNTGGSKSGGFGGGSSGYSGSSARSASSRGASSMGGSRGGGGRGGGGRGGGGRR